MGHLISPAIQKNLPSAPAVADIGTGTGAWLLTTSKELPTQAKLHGYDISDAQFPAPGQLPQNITLTTLDAKAPAPVHLHGQYDLVHLRLLNAAMLPEDWFKVATHAWSLLKPGGALQWVEGNFRNLNVVYQSERNTKTSALSRGVDLTTRPRPHFDWFVDHLRDVLRSVGFEVVEQQVLSSDRLPQDRMEWSHIATGALHAIMRGNARMGVEGALAAEEAKSLAQEMRKECDEGAYFRVDTYEFVAIKK